jgi:arginase
MPIKIIGIPFDGKSSFLRGAAMAPNVIRQCLHNGSSNYMTEIGLNVEDAIRAGDSGDLPLSIFEDIYPQLKPLVTNDHKYIFLGGDHSITYPLVKAMHEVYGTFDILHFDAHTDLYDVFEGDRYSHACPFARIMESGMASRLVQVGIRTVTPHQRAQAERFGVDIIDMRHLSRLKDIRFQKNLYISIDLDGFDPAFAPGVSHHEAGGLIPRDVINYILDLECNIIGADIVELNPIRDIQGITAALASKLLKEIAAKMIQ